MNTRDRGALTARHPLHYNEWGTVRDFSPGPVIPQRASWPLRWQVERACHRAGGHWWHTVGPRTRPGGIAGNWACCQCGKPTKGVPRNGARR